MQALPYGSLLHREDCNVLLAALQNCRQSPGSVELVRYRLLTKSERWVWKEARTRNLLKDPAVAAMVVHYRDVTAQVEAEKELAHARDQAEHASRVKSDFLATMSH